MNLSAGTESPDRARLLAALRKHRALGLPLTAAQQGIWLAESLDPGRSGYHDTAVLRIEGPLDPEALRGALNDVQALHEALRARVIANDGEPRQFFDVTELDYRPVDISAVPQEAQRARLDRLIAAVAVMPFTLESGPIWRARLIRLAAHEHVLVLVVHHLIADGWSHGVLLGSLLACYAARSRGERRPPASPGYADWLTYRVRRERELVSQGTATEVASSLTRVPYRLQTPGFDPDPPDRSAAEMPIPLSAAAWAAFRVACKRYQATQFMALTGLFGATVARAAGRDDVLMSAPVAGRYDPAAAGLLGCFINVVPLNVRVAAGATPPVAIAAGTAAVMTALRYPELPYREVVRAAGAPTGADDPLTNIGIDEFNAPAGEVSMGALRIVPLPRGQLRPRHDLTLTVGPEAPVLLYPSARWARERVSDLAGDLAQSITAVIR